MVSRALEDYEVLSILGTNLNSTCYKVKNKNTSEIFVWRAISYKSSGNERSLISQIEKLKGINHPYLLQIYNFILHEDTKMIYLVTEYCANGNLSCIIHKCLSERKYLNEHFLWLILYQLACVLKLYSSIKSCLNNIFVDSDYNIKLFNNSILKTETAMTIGQIIYELSTLQPHKKNSNALDNSNYSNDLKEIVKFSVGSKIMIDSILCHPTVLLKSRLKVTNIFTSFEDSHGEPQTTRLENFKSREMALRIKERKLIDKAYYLQKREKKLALMERAVKEKITHAELYLKRCREGKNNSQNSYQSLNSSLSADCGDSSFAVKTSNKLNLNTKKPFHFSRSHSERHVRFKGHSPLKEMCFKEKVIVEEKLPNSNASRKKLFGGFSSRCRKPLSDLNDVQNGIVYETNDHNDGGIVQYPCRPVSWTEESKQQAFDLLRIMKQDDQIETIKHTYL